MTCTIVQLRPAASNRGTTVLRRVLPAREPPHRARLRLIVNVGILIEVGPLIRLGTNRSRVRAGTTASVQHADTTMYPQRHDGKDTVLALVQDGRSTKGRRMRFAGRVVVVTGGSKGIGAGCARVFCAEGGLVSILSRGLEAGEELAAELTRRGPGRAIFAPCDVREHEQIKEAIDRTAQAFGRIDCLINNAGWHPPATTIDNTSMEDMTDMLRWNYLSTFAGVKYALPHLRQTKGTIINMSSMVAILGQKHSSAYCATKGAQLSLTKALAVELGEEGIRVNAILPGNVDTPLMHEWANTLPDPASALERVAALQVFGRMATADEIGKIALFLATEDSSFLTGQAIEAEGGASLDY